MPDTLAQSGFALRLRAARTAMGLSQADLGRRMGLPDEVASTRINRYERGVHLPDIPTARALAEALGVPVSALVEDEEDIAIVAACMGQLGKRERARFVKAIQKALGKERTQKVLVQLGITDE